MNDRTRARGKTGRQSFYRSCFFFGIELILIDPGLFFRSFAVSGGSIELVFALLSRGGLHFLFLKDMIKF